MEPSRVAATTIYANHSLRIVGKAILGLGHSHQARQRMADLSSTIVRTVVDEPRQERVLQEQASRDYSARIRLGRRPFHNRRQRFLRQSFLSTSGLPSSRMYAGPCLKTRKPLSRRILSANEALRSRPNQGLRCDLHHNLPVLRQKRKSPGRLSEIAQNRGRPIQGLRKWKPWISMMISLAKALMQLFKLTEHPKIKPLSRLQVLTAKTPAPILSLVYST